MSSVGSATRTPPQGEKLVEFQANSPKVANFFGAAFGVSAIAFATLSVITHLYKDDYPLLKFCHMPLISPNGDGSAQIPAALFIGSCLGTLYLIRQLAKSRFKTGVTHTAYDAGTAIAYVVNKNRIPEFLANIDTFLRNNPALPNDLLNGYRDKLRAAAIPEADFILKTDEFEMLEALANLKQSTPSKVSKFSRIALFANAAIFLAMEAFRYLNKEVEIVPLVNRYLPARTSYFGIASVTFGVSALVQYLFRNYKIVPHVQRVIVSCSDPNCSESHAKPGYLINKFAAINFLISTSNYRRDNNDPTLNKLHDKLRKSMDQRQDLLLGVADFQKLIQVY